MIVDSLMESRWTGDSKRDEALHEAIHTTLGLWGFCEVLAHQCSTETDERMATTTRVVRRCAKVCETAIVELANWEMIVPGALEAAVEAGFSEEERAVVARYLRAATQATQRAAEDDR